MRLDNLKIVVTGGMGYVGSHTCKALLAAGAEVISVDYRYVEQNRLAGVEYISADYGDEEVWHMFAIHRGLDGTSGLDGIVHCAGTSLVGPSVLDPAEYYENNVMKTIAMLDALRDENLKPFIVFSSSAAVYGNPESLPIKEDSRIRPIHPYGNTKMMIERILEDYEIYGFRNYCYRYFNAAGADVWDNELGPEPGDTHIIPRIFEAAQEGKIFKLFGTDYDTEDGTCVRDYIHVCDLALAHLRACVELSTGGESKIYNLGTSKGYSNGDILEAFKDLVSDVAVLEEDRREGDPDSLVADASLIKHELDWQPMYSDLTTIINSFKDYYEKKHN